jgi:hypothetical protein
MEASLKRSHTRIFPTHALSWFMVGLLLAYIEAAALLAPLGVPLLPGAWIRDILRQHLGFVLLLAGIPLALYVLVWRAADLFDWLRSPRSLTVDAEGLSADARRIRWRDVHEFTEDSARDLLVLRHTGGTLRVWLSLWTDAGALHESLHEHAVAKLLPRVSQRVASGEAVRFGPLTLGSAGLTHRGQLMRWDDIESIRFQDEVDTGVASRELIIVAGGRTRKFDEAKVLNAPVLLAYLSDRLAG